LENQSSSINANKINTYDGGDDSDDYTEEGWEVEEVESEQWSGVGEGEGWKDEVMKEKTKKDGKPPSPPSPPSDAFKNNGLYSDDSKNQSSPNRHATVTDDKNASATTLSDEPVACPKCRCVNLKALGAYRKCPLCSWVGRVDAAAQTPEG
jgi:hypothetical protein